MVFAQISHPCTLYCNFAVDSAKTQAEVCVEMNASGNCDGVAEQNSCTDDFAVVLADNINPTGQGLDNCGLGARITSAPVISGRTYLIEWNDQYLSPSDSFVWYYHLTRQEITVTPATQTVFETQLFSRLLVGAQ